MINDNVGELMQQMIGADEKGNLRTENLKKIRNNFDYTANYTVKNLIKNFKSGHGEIKTFLKFANILNYKVKFIIKNKEKIENDNLFEILEIIRRKKGKNKTLFAKEDLNLSSYTHTQKSFKNYKAKLRKIYEVFEEKLGYKFLIKAEKKEDQYDCT